MGVKKTKKKDTKDDISSSSNTNSSIQLIHVKKSKIDPLTLPPFLRSINRLDSSGFSPLHYAVRENNQSSVKHFILNHGDINVTDSYGKLAIEWASKLGYIKIFLLLINLGSKIPSTMTLPYLGDKKELYQRENNKTCIQKIKDVLKTIEKETKKTNNNNNDDDYDYSLDISFLYFSRLPSSFKNLSDYISEINLSYNNLLSIPSELTLFKNLKILKLNNNMISNINDDIMNLGLQKLIISYNYLKLFPPITDKSVKLSYLDISYNYIEIIPNDIANLYRLTYFNCSGNYLEEIPKSIVEILGIKELNISHNFITHLRDIPIHLLLSLEKLNISYNSIETIPYSDIMNSQTINEFNFSHNKIPELIFRILKSYYDKTLKLDLSSMNLIKLIPEITLLTQLRDLNVSDNCFEVLPDEIGSLVNLTNLDISYNKIKDLPLFLHRLTNLQSLNIEETKSHIINPSKNIIDRGLKNILGYYYDLLQGEPCYRLKLMFVGQENVGKSTLLHALKTFKLKKKTKRNNISTDGIDIERWQLKTIQKHTITFSAWDFAGQEIYYATHSLFLSSQAIYLIVFDLRNPNGARIEFWLNSVASRAAKAPVLLIGTHLDDPQFENDINIVKNRLQDLHKKYKSRFPNIKKITAVSATDYAGIGQLHDQLGDVGLTMPSIQDALPKIYQNLEDLILEVKQTENPPAVNWIKFTEIASKVNFKDESQLLRATQFLNDLGSLVFFEDEITDERLIVLDPQWLTAMFASVITTSHTYIKNGILKLSAIGQIWRAPQYPPEMHSTLLSLLKKFEIIYELPKDENNHTQFLIPNLLPEERPPIDLLWLDYDPKSIQYSRRYTLEFIPNGMFSKFMVRFLHFTDTPLKFWRTGVLAQQNGDKGLIELIDTTIFITVRGETSSEILRIIVEIIETLVNSWFKVTITKAVVPCPHCLQINNKNPVLFDLLECEQAAARHNARIIQCPYDSSTVRLDHLVPDIAMTDFQGCQIFPSDVELEKSIGKGSFGEIFKGKWKGDLVAIKKLKTGEDMGIAAFAEFRREVWLMTGLKHPCIVNLKGFSTNPLMMIMECVTGGDLFGMIHNDNIDMNWHLRLKLAVDMAFGMAFLHGINPPLLHRDLKSPNVLVMDHKEGTLAIAKIADFGLSSRLFVDVLKDRAVENPTWCAPEVLQNKPYTIKADVYSYGMMLWELLTRELPFDNYKFQYQVEDDVIKGIRPSIPSNCYEGYSELIRICWAPNPDERPTFPEIISKIRIIIEEEIGFDNFKYPFSPIESNNNEIEQAPQLDTLTTRKDRVESPSQVLTGSLTKKITVNCEKPIESIIQVTNQAWCATLDGSIHIYSTESGSFLTSYKSEQSSISSLLEIGNRVWSGSQGVITIWTIDDLVTVNVYDIKIKTGILTQKSTDKKRFASKKGLLRYCVLYKSGYFRIYKNQGDEVPLYDIFLKNASVTITSKGRLQISYADNSLELYAKVENETHSWLAEIQIILAQFSEIPLAQECIRRVHQTANLSCMLKINDNCIFVGAKSSVLVVDNRARITEEIRLPSDIHNPIIYDLLDNRIHVWVAVNNKILRINSTTYKLVNILEAIHFCKINALVATTDEVWAAADDGITCWDSKTGNFICFASKKLKVRWTCLVETTDTIWAGTDTGSISIFDKKTKQELSQIKQHKSAIKNMALIMGSLIWSCSEKEICIWK